MIVPLCAFPPQAKFHGSDRVSRTTWALDGALSRHIFLRVKRGDVTDGTTYVWQPQDSSERSGMLGRISAVQVWEEVEMQTI